MAYFTILLFYIFYIHGGPIQKVVLDKIEELNNEYENKRNLALKYGKKYKN